MTVLIGYKKGDTAYIAADRQMSDGSSVHPIDKITLLEADGVWALAFSGLAAAISWLRSEPRAAEILSVASDSPQTRLYRLMKAMRETVGNKDHNDVTGLAIWKGQTFSLEIYSATVFPIEEGDPHVDGHGGYTGLGAFAVLQKIDASDPVKNLQNAILTTNDLISGCGFGVDVAVSTPTETYILRNNGTRETV